MQKHVGRIGRKLYPALMCSIAAAGLLLGCPHGTAALAEDSVVADEQPDAESQVTAVQEAQGSSDPSQVDGLFELVGDQSGYAGESVAGDSSDDKKKKKKDEKKLIVGFRQVGAQASIHFEMGEKPSLEKLRQQFPSSLDVYFLGEKKTQTVDVTWESYGDDYSSTDLNYYFFTPKFNADKYEVKGLNLQSESPYIEVIQDAFTYEMIESAPPKENEAAVFKYCTEKLGLNTAAACGVLANIYCESGFRTNAIGDGGTSVGICQWHNGRWTNLRNFAPDDWQTLDGQLRFMRKELNGGYKATLKYIRRVSDDEQGAYDAAYYWCMHYEMPDRILSRSTTRAYLARNVYWKRYGLGEEETEDMSGNETEAETEADNTSDAETEAETDSSSGDAETVKETADKPDEDSYAGLYRCISDDGLNIREERSTEVDTTGFIPYDAEVKVLSADGEWARVSYDGAEGYSRLEFLERVQDETETQQGRNDKPSPDGDGRKG